LPGCTARIALDYSAFRKRNRFGNVTSALRLFEIARVLVRFNHVARIIAAIIFARAGLGIHLAKVNVNGTRA
jgi:hypothetical protein